MIYRNTIFFILFVIPFVSAFSQELSSVTDTLSKDIIEIYSVLSEIPAVRHGNYEQYYKGNLVIAGMYKENLRSGEWMLVNGKNFRAAGNYSDNEKQGDWSVIKGRDTIAVITYEEDKPIEVYTPYDKKIRKASTKSIDEKTIKTLDNMPVFEGGNLDKYRAYVNANLIFPQVEEDALVQGKIYVEFIVNEIGQTQDVRVLSGLFPAFDEQAVKVIQNSPPWIPGIKDGEPIKVKFIFPIVFKF